MTNSTNNNGALFKATSASAIIAALVMLFNPNVNIIDILPDFIGYFILAKVIEPAADCAPYFEEARSGFLKLGFVSLCRIPALFIAMAARSGNTMDNDIIVLLTLIFAIAESILTFSAIRSLFDALAYLGQRSEAASLITFSLTTDDLKTFSLIFLIGKQVLAFLPESLKLTRSIDNGGSAYFATGSQFYNPALTVAFIIVLAVGIAWLSKTVSYVKFVKNEGKFDDALLSLASESAPDEYAKNKAYRNYCKGFTMLTVAALLSFRVHFDNYYDVNLLPPMLFGIVFSLGLLIIATMLNMKKFKYCIYACGGLFTVISTVNYILSNNFLVNYGYSQLYLNSNTDAVELYRTVMILSTVEFICLIALCACLIPIALRFFDKELTVSLSAEGSRINAKEYTRPLLVRTIAFVCICIVSGLSKLIDVYIHSDIQLIFTSPSDITMPTIMAPSLPWFNTVVILCCAIFAIYAFYYSGLIKTELHDKMKGYGSN